MSPQTVDKTLPDCQLKVFYLQSEGTANNAVPCLTILDRTN